MPRRRTKILATIGPATASQETISALVDAGMDAARINCSHGNAREWRRSVEFVRAAAREADRPVAVVFDLQGPKIRLAEDVPVRDVRRGERIVAVQGETSPADGIAIPYAGVLASAQPGRSELVVGDGTPRFAVESVSGRGAARQAVLRCVRPGTMGPRKGALITHAHARNQVAVTEKDLADLLVARSCKADFVALSYVHRAKDVRDLRKRMAELNFPARIIAKIETIAAMEALEDIVAASHAVMVARGDLGVEAGVAQVPVMQRTIVHECARQGRLSIMATQMLESMVQNSEPTRAEATDISTAVIQGSSALMLSAETTIGKYPVEAVRAMGEIAYAVEGQGRTSPPPQAPRTDVESVMRAAAALGEAVGAAAYVVPTSSGGSVRALAMHRPDAPVVALAHNVETARHLALEWGVVPAVIPMIRSLDEMIDHSVARAQEMLHIPKGAPVVLTSGTRVDAPGSTSLIALRHVGAAPRKKKPRR
jgi:pyruvate kinase